jgi:putative heme-binding domain-containing protein
VRDGETVLARLAEAYRTGTLDPALALDVLEAAELLTTDTPSESAFGTWPTSDLAFAETILSDGGDPANGRDLFLHHETAQCLRCHTIDDLGGTAGPNLTHIASRLTKPEIIESLINPHARISPGYATLALTLKTGESISATIVEQDADKVVIDDAGHNRTISRSQIRAQAGPVSAMPVMPQFLSPYEARDLVAYLVTLVDPALGPATTPFYAAPTAARADETAVLLTAGAVVRLAVGTFVGFAILAVIIALVLVRISRATA